jgi:hypothetical protein
VTVKVEAVTNPVNVGLAVLALDVIAVAMFVNSVVNSEPRMIFAGSPDCRESLAAKSVVTV